MMFNRNTMKHEKILLHKTIVNTLRSPKASSYPEGRSVITPCHLTKTSCEGVMDLHHSY